MADKAFLRRIAVDASCDPESVRRYLEVPEHKMRPTTRERIEFALIDRGLRQYLRPPVAIDLSPKTQA